MSMNDISRGSFRRTTKIASFGLEVAGRGMLGFGKKLAGQDKETVNAELLQKSAEQLFSVLGELKGGAMKMGQVLSVFEVAVPKELAEPFREALAKLQDEAPPMPAKKIHQVLDQQLGTKWRERFQSFDDAPSASASIGQVHRGVWSDGRPVAVKVQYPGADHALRSDFKTMRRLTGVFKAVSPGTDFDAIMDEIDERVEEELDYRSEASNQRHFAKIFAGDSDYLVPKVVASSPKVIVSEWVEGTSMRKIIASGSQTERDHAAARLWDFQFAAMERAKLLHGDPHPGNFMFLPDGRMAALDFGTCAPYPEGVPSWIGEVVTLALDDDYDGVVEVMRRHDFFRAGYSATPEQVRGYLRPLCDPLHTEDFHFNRSWAQETANPYTDVRGENWQTGRQMNAPASHLLLFRVISSCAAISAQLDARVPLRSIVKQWNPSWR